MKNKRIIYISSFAIVIIILLGIYKAFFTTGSVHTSVNKYKQPHLNKNYDVIVIGGEPEGVAAAVAAARSGSKTLLIEHRNGLGGLMTYGDLNFLDVSNDMNGDPANQGIFKEWNKLVGGKVGFDIEDAKLAFLKLVQDESNLTLALDTNVISVVKDKESDKVTAINIKDYKGKNHTIKGKRFIDSTQNADFAVMAGAASFEGGADIGLENRKMAATLMIHLKNVDWAGIEKAAKSGVFGGGTVVGNVSWGFGQLHHKYIPHYQNTHLRGLNIVKQDDGSIYINALQIFGVDGLNQESKDSAIKTGKKETKYIVDFLKKNFPGFEKAEIASYPEELYIRETRHILAEYQLPMSDVWENNDQWDSIGFGAYPVDVQATSPDNYGQVIADPKQYAIPFRSLVPLKINGLLVASKASGYSSLAAGSARVIPTGMTTGQAAGVAATISINKNISFRDMTRDKSAISELRKKLKDQGALLYHFNIVYPYQGEWYYPAIKKLLNYGLAAGGYNNELPVDKVMSEQGFANLLSNSMQRVTPENVNNVRIENMKSILSKEPETVTRNKAAELIAAMNGRSLKGVAAWDWLKKKGMLDNVILAKLQHDKRLESSEGYYLTYLFIKDITNRGN